MSPITEYLETWREQMGNRIIKESTQALSVNFKLKEQIKNQGDTYIYILFFIIILLLLELSMNVFINHC